jgi:hypothetical protein
VHWRDRIGDFQRDIGDGEHAEILISDRTYRVRVGDLPKCFLVLGYVSITAG